MQVSIETMSGLERRLTISVPSEEFENQITGRLTEARERARIPGFRPGKVPLKEVRRRYGNAVRAEVAGELMQSSFYSAVEQESLAPAGSPNLEVVKMDPGIDFEFTATFEVFPAIELADFGKVSVKRPSAEIGEDDVNQMIDNLRKQRQTWEDVERPIAEGDKVTVDFKGTLNGEEFPGGSGEDLAFEVGAGQMIDDFDQAVRGTAKGAELDFPATFPDDYQAEDLRGKTVQFAVTVKSVTEPRLPELNDEFFKDFEVTEGGEAAFREQVQGNMQREMDQAAKRQLKQQVIDELARLHSIAVPHSLVHREIHVLKDQMLQQFQSYGAGANSANLPELPDAMFHDQAEKRVVVGLVINEIVSGDDLSADQERVDEAVAELAQGYGEPEQVIRWYKSNPEQMQQIEMQVLEDQVIDLILAKAEIEEVIASYADVVAGTAIPKPDSEEADTEAEDAQAST